GRADEISLAQYKRGRRTRRICGWGGFLTIIHMIKIDKVTPNNFFTIKNLLCHISMAIPQKSYDS
ncbi:MAG: hypothetical protein MR508_06770, partial [Lachnospiraceae bacterium]|nr:hypothetical protein [Lachnospiraceae bacterium]